MKISVKVRGSSSTPVILEVGSDDSLASLKLLITEKTGIGDFQLFRGDCLLDESQDQSAIASLFVNGERLFLEQRDPSKISSLSSQSASSVSQERMEVSDSVPEIPKEDPRSFFDNVKRNVRNYMEDANFSSENMTSWTNVSNMGCEMSFVPSRSVYKNSHYADEQQISVICMAFSEPNITTLINVFRISKSSRDYLNSFHVYDQRNLQRVVAEGLGQAVLHAGYITLPQLFQIALIRDGLLNHLPAVDVARLGAVNRLLSSTMSSKDVDNRYWKKKLMSDFSEADIAMSTEGTYRKRYMDCSIRRKEKLSRQNLRQAPESYLMDPLQDTRVRPPMNPYPNINPYAPIGPLGPQVPSPFAPRHDPFGGGGNPGLGPNPWDPMYGEVLPQRQPLPRGPRYLPPRGGDFPGSFDHDFI